MTDINKEFIKHRSNMLALLRKLNVAPPEEVEDILQETYIRTYHSSLKKEIHFPKAFMIKTALRLANRYREKSARMDFKGDVEDYSASRLYQDKASLFSDDSFDGRSSDPESQLINKRDFEQLCTAINQLPTKCRKVFILKKVYGLSQREIATNLVLSESTVEKHVAKGLFKIHAYMQELNKATSECDDTAQDSKNILDLFDKKFVKK